MDTITELRRLADDLTELGDNATAALVCQAIDRFSAWKFEAGEELLERAFEERRKHEHEPPRSAYFNTCVLAIAQTIGDVRTFSGRAWLHVEVNGHEIALNADTNRAAVEVFVR